MRHAALTCVAPRAGWSWVKDMVIVIGSGVGMLTGLIVGALMGEASGGFWVGMVLGGVGGYAFSLLSRPSEEPHALEDSSDTEALDDLLEEIERAQERRK